MYGVFRRRPRVVARRRSYSLATYSARAHLQVDGKAPASSSAKATVNRIVQIAGKG